jgi:SAM-dependent methyltransferase
MRMLSIGCGNKPPAPDLVRLDICADVEPDVVWDLDRLPYPFENESFTEIECFDVIEHLSNISATLQEIHRILEPNGILKITTPHFSCANSYVDPTHKYHLSYFSFDYFCEGHELSYYSEARYEIKYRHIYFQGGRFSRSIIRRLANMYPKSYEQRWSWIFPAWYIYVELVAIK